MAPRTITRVAEIQALLNRSRRGKALEHDERLSVATALDAVMDGKGRVAGLEAVRILWDKPESFEGSGRFSAIYRAVLEPDKLSEAQREEMLLDLEVHDHYRANPETTLADYQKVRRDLAKAIDARSAAEVKGEVVARLKRIGFWKAKKRRYEGVVLVGLKHLSKHTKGKPRRELRQEFLYGIEHDNLLSILIGAVTNGHLVQFEEYWGYRDWRSLTLEERVGLALDTAQGLAYLHQLNVVHRDVKPANVLVKGRKPPRAKVCDYGLIDSEDMGKHGVTKTEDGTVVGTILYMSPEQARGETTKASDVFSLGGLLYTYLTEKPPTPIPLGATRHEQSDQVLHRRKKPQDPLTLLEVDDRSKHDRELLRRLTLIVAGCLQEEPEQRYADVNDVIADLEAALAERPPQRLTAHVKRLRIPIDLYRNSVFSPVAAYPESEPITAELVTERDSSEDSGGAIARLSSAALKLVLVGVIVTLVTGCATLWLNPAGYGDLLHQELLPVREQVEALVERLGLG